MMDSSYTIATIAAIVAIAIVAIVAITEDTISAISAIEAITKNTVVIEVIAKDTVTETSFKLNTFLLLKFSIVASVSTTTSTYSI